MWCTGDFNTLSSGSDWLENKVYVFAFDDMDQFHSVMDTLD